jgi:hypothetical protein
MLMRSVCCRSGVFSMPGLISIKFGMYIMAPKLITTAPYTLIIPTLGSSKLLSSRKETTV